MMCYDENIRDRNTVICDDWNNACSLMKALWEISHEPGAVGEYAICVTDEDGIRVDFKFVPYDDESVVFCTESELYEMMKSTEQDVDQDVKMDREQSITIVRCKDCRHRDPEDHKCDSGALERAGCVFPVADDYFCSCGERRENADN